MPAGAHLTAAVSVAPEHRGRLQCENPDGSNRLAICRSDFLLSTSLALLDMSWPRVNVLHRS